MREHCTSCQPLEDLNPAIPWFEFGIVTLLNIISCGLAIIGYVTNVPPMTMICGPIALACLAGILYYIIRFSLIGLPISVTIDQEHELHAHEPRDDKHPNNGGGDCLWSVGGDSKPIRRPRNGPVLTVRLGKFGWARLQGIPNSVWEVHRRGDWLELKSRVVPISSLTIRFLNPDREIIEHNVVTALRLITKFQTTRGTKGPFLEIFETLLQESNSGEEESPTVPVHPSTA